MKTTDNALKRAIRATGLSYEKTAAKLGISRNTLERCANGRQCATHRTASRIRELLGDEAIAGLKIVTTERAPNGTFKGSVTP
jgi:predicted transcriptional regulator